MTTFALVLEAKQRLAGVAHRTPIVTSETLNRLAGAQIFLKCENFQRAGAFKFRGAYNRLSQLSEEEKKHGVLAYSSGNHAQAVALAARLVGTRAVIVMPSDAPKVKVEATRGYGAEIVFYDRQKEERETIARKLARERNMTIVPPFDHPAIIAGAGTAGHELMEEVPDLDAVVVPVGGGGFASGTCLAVHGLSPKVKVYGVEPEIADDTRQSLQQGKRVKIAPPKTIADGLRTLAPGELTFPILQTHLADLFTVSEEEILDALRFAFTRLKIVIEPSSAVALAAVLNRKLPADRKRVGVLISGGNIDLSLMRVLFE
jgi:threonine ammonia-lyase medium form